MYAKAAKFIFWFAVLTFIAAVAFLLLSDHHGYKQHTSTAIIVAALLGIPLRYAHQYVIDPVGKAISELKFVDDPVLANFIQPLLNDIDSDVRVGRYESPELNAFAVSSVFGKKSAIAFSTALINNLPPAEFMAIAAHEVAHIKNADSKYKSYLLAFHQMVNFYPALIAHFSKELLMRVAGLILFVAVVMFLIIVKSYDVAGIFAALKLTVPLLAPILVLLSPIFGAFLLNRATDLFFLHYGRQREFVADADGAAMTSIADMKSALQLISNGTSSKMSFFDSHPPTAERLNRL